MSIGALSSHKQAAKESLFAPLLPQAEASDLTPLEAYLAQASEETKLSKLAYLFGKIAGEFNKNHNSLKAYIFYNKASDSCKNCIEDPSTGKKTREWATKAQECYIRRRDRIKKNPILDAIPF